MEETEEENNIIIDENQLNERDLISPIAIANSWNIATTSNETLGSVRTKRTHQASPIYSIFTTQSTQQNLDQPNIIDISQDI